MRAVLGGRLAAAALTAGLVTGAAVPAPTQPAVVSADSPASAVTPDVRTLRLDYVHTGGPGVEVFAVDRVVVEPLPWPGHPERAIDDGDAGHYRFQVREPGGRLLYSRGFSSIFGEWKSTAEAASTHRSFHESLRFPMPAAPVSVSVHRRDADQRFEQIWQTTVDPNDLFVDRAPPASQTLLRLEEHGAPAQKVDLLMLGDGYTAGECASRFADDAGRLIEALFRHEPFRNRRNDFNVWGLCPPAAESGISRPSTGVHRRTPVGATYDAFGSERYVLTFDNRALRDVAAWAPYEFVTIVVNADTYGGGGIYNTFATVAARSDWAEYLFVHEFGHHFAALADEYYTSPVAYEPVERIVEPWEPNVTALLDAHSLKWRDLVRAGTRLPTPWPKDVFEARQREFQAERKRLRAERRPEHEMSALFRAEQAYTARLFGARPRQAEVGAFQGANYNARAFYRPQLDCVMFTRDEVPFCRVCQRALARVIDQYAPPLGCAECEAP